MREFLDNNDILMYSICKEGMSVIAERLKTLEANDSKSNLSYLNQLVGC